MLDTSGIFPADILQRAIVYILERVHSDCYIEWAKTKKRESIEMSYSAHGDDFIRFIRDMVKLLYFFLPVIIPASGSCGGIIYGGAEFRI